MRLLHLPIVSILNNHLLDYPTPSNINYFWGFGSLAGLCLVIQIVTGVCLAMHYTPHVDLAFASVEHIMRDVNNGWILRYLHANGASIFFVVVYLHIGRGLYFSSYVYPRGVLWISGIVIFLLMMGTGFIGYVLPWGQMSFWGATVITNLVTAVPLVGEPIAIWVWGGFSVDNATLNRFFSLHYLLPFLIAGLALLHLVLLHMEGSSNPLGICSKIDRVGFYPYFVVKDILGLIFMIIVFFLCVCNSPNYLGHTDNYILANPLVTPTHIVPEWYFLPFYAILRSIPSKLGGVIFMLMAIIILMFLPLLYPTVYRNPQVKPLFSIFYWLSISNFLLLGWLGSQVVEAPFVLLGQLSTFFYFFYFIVILPVLCWLEKYLFKY